MNYSIYSKLFALKRKPIKQFFRLPHKINKENIKVDSSKVAPDVLKFLENNADYSKLKDKIPKSLLRKYKTPESMYLINKKGAEHIVKTIINKLQTNSPIVEVNPGFCFLTRELLKKQNGKVYMYETSNNFNDFINEIALNNNSRVVCKFSDFFGMWKLAFQDKMDQGTRMKDLLGDLASEDPNRLLQIVGAMPGLSFMKYLLTTIFFHNTTNLLGRPDLYIIMPGHHYEFLTDSQIQNCKHKFVPALFQLIFDYKMLGKVPKLNYLPWMHPSSSKHTSVIDDHFMYIVNITQKETLPCHHEYLPELWYFFRPHIISKSTRVIPMLEQWIPGCGIWLITGQDPPDTNEELGPDETDAELPHMTIFTEFGDLTLQQKVTVFKKFISWPEFEQCPFRVTMENNLPKFITAADVDAKRRGTHVDEDEHSDDDDDDVSDNERS